MLIDAGSSSTEKAEKLLGQVLSRLATTTRDTDIKGWYKNKVMVGVMFTEIVIDNDKVHPEYDVS